ncbi:MAG: hypothetical protein B7Z55_07670 [Planctomycetales bacterium 12-60-4]|nr:MAG: hypothetical protein B7Z55_07670 [Planctomycetales bacterium 12-60-4]
MFRSYIFRSWSSGLLTTLLWLACSWTATVRAQDAEAPERITPAIIRGRPEQDLVNVNSARYFVWHGSDGWHLRSASKSVNKFTGSIRLQGGGTIYNLRPVGLEKKGSAADRWGINEDRTELRFEVITGGSFDGFDFTVKDADAATIEFHLLIGRDPKSMPGRIFLGQDSKHPQQSTFVVPAEPKRE